MSVTIYEPPRKIEMPNENTYDADWIANPRCEDASDAEKKLIDNRADILVYAEISDDEADYSYDDFALVRLGDDWYLLQTSGCSCPSPSETWGVDIGPATLEEVKKFVMEGEYAGYSVPQRQMDEFLLAFDAAAK